MDEKLSHGFVLGGSIVEPRLGIVITKGEARHLAPRAMAVLLLLAEHRDRVVTHDYIATHFWQNDNISHGTLSRLISEIRRSLDDDPRHPQFVETVPQQGYRLICSVVAEDDLGDEMFDPGGNNSNGKKGVRAFYAELRQRRVFRATVMYLLTFWVVLQVGEIVIPALRLPEWALTLLLLLGILGLPIAVTLAWVLQLTPAGVVLDIAQTQRSASGSQWLRLDLVLIAVLFVVIIFLSGQLLMLTG